MCVRAQAVSYHLLPTPVFSSSLSDGLRYRFHTLSDDDLYMETRTGSAYVTVNQQVRVIDSDIESTSGVIHVINDVLQCPCVDGFRRWNV